MTDLHDALTQYIEIRRAFGTTLARVGIDVSDFADPEPADRSPTPRSLACSPRRGSVPVRRSHWTRRTSIWRTASFRLERASSASHASFD
jgi:hypothetical protein